MIAPLVHTPPGYFDADLDAAVAEDPLALGIASSGEIRKSKALAIEECGYTYLPAAFLIKTQAYPLTRRLHLTDRLIRQPRRQRAS